MNITELKQQIVEWLAHKIAQVHEAVDAGPNCSTIEAVLGTLKAYESCADDKRKLEAQLEAAEQHVKILREQLREREAQYAAMREALKSCLPMATANRGLWDKIKYALSTDAGKAMLERLQKAEEGLKQERQNHLNVLQYSKVISQEEYDRLQGVKSRKKL